uniref:uncharacterized protein isoform X2 n=1 Tax=Myxine glutinosa TaxID=7769 RepID=UPI00358E0087
MAEVSEWRAETVLKLVELYESHPCLWSTSRHDYHNKIARLRALQVIAVQIGRSVYEVKTKLSNLRTQYTREKARARATPKSGSGTVEVYHSKWWLLPKMAFLEDYVTSRQTTTTGNSSSCDEPDLVPMLNEAYESTREQDTASDRFESSQVLTSDVKETLPISPPRQWENAGRWNKRAKRIAEDEIIVSKAIENMARVAERFERPPIPPVSAQVHPVTDADVHFGHFVTAQLKNIQNVDAKHDALRSILNVLLDAQRVPAARPRATAGRSPVLEPSTCASDTISTTGCIHTIANPQSNTNGDPTIYMSQYPHLSQSSQ